VVKEGSGEGREGVERGVVGMSLEWSGEVLSAAARRSEVEGLASCGRLKPEVASLEVLLAVAVSVVARRSEAGGLLSCDGHRA
jgi:hypothetical protein